MQPSRRYCFYASLALLGSSLLAPRSHAEKMTITSSPAGATVEIDGRVAGTTPFQADYPDGYFHKSHSVFGARLRHSMVARISKYGYLPEEVSLTDGPFEWVAITRRRRMQYFLLKPDVHDTLVKAASNDDTASVDAAGRIGPMPLPSDIGPASAEAGPGLDTGTVKIASDPSHAEIFADGKFAGRTPATIQLAAGSHRIELRARNKQSWERTVTVLKDGQLSLHVVLAKLPPSDPPPCCIGSGTP